MDTGLEEDLKKSPGKVALPPVETLTFRTEPVSQYSAVIGELRTIAQDLSLSPRKIPIYFISMGIGAVLIVNMVGQIFLNRWQGDFYRAIEQKRLDLVWVELVSFAELVSILLAVVVAQTFLHERFKIRFREWLTHHLLDSWLVPGRAYRLAISSDDAINPDQRIQEDVRNFSELSSDLGIGLMQAGLILVSFIGVLWSMSYLVSFHWHGRLIHVPGYMVWGALVYATVGSWLTGKVGRPLIALNEERYTREAKFRFSIVRVNESAESVAFYSGEADEQKIIVRGFDNVLDMMGRVSFALARLTWITSGYGWVAIVLPVLIALPGYLDGALDLGGLMMVVGAFNQVQQSLRWFVDSFVKIADWRAALHRVIVFRDAMAAIDEYENQAERIQLIPHPEGKLEFEGTMISLADGNVVISDATAKIELGERVLIVGESGSGKSTLFRAVGGLWPWGSGVIKVPPRSEIMFLPQKPYIPIGSLAEALAYPRGATNPDEALMKEALEKVNLLDFVELLYKVEPWDKLMSLGQQQRLAFARLLIHRPKWVFLDEATSALDDENQNRVMRLVIDELPRTTVLSIGHRPNLGDYHNRTLQLTTTTAGTILHRKPKLPTHPGFWSRVIMRLTKSASGPAS